MKNKAIIGVNPLGTRWPVKNPFIFCAHHLDYYPPGNKYMEPETSLDGRNIGNDFEGRDGWRMYHGDRVPGFPVHPHRGFETITIVKTGFVDHSDSHGEAGRYGEGDVQWMTAGAGLQHSEMFPLLNEEGDNPLELFQVWLNLPKSKKFVEPHFKMLWAEEIPRVIIENGVSGRAEVDIIAGTFEGTRAPDPAPDSWASSPENEVTILTIKLESDVQILLPPASRDTSRTIYFYRGGEIFVNEERFSSGRAIDLSPNADVVIKGGSEVNLITVLQGKRIDEPVVQYGPFVMNTNEEILKAFEDYRRTEFGGWPWERRDNVHPREKGRFAKYRNSF